MEGIDAFDLLRTRPGCWRSEPDFLQMGVLGGWGGVVERSVRGTVASAHLNTICATHPQTGDRLKAVVAGVVEGTMELVVDPLAASLRDQLAEKDRLGNGHRFVEAGGAETAPLHDQYRHDRQRSGASRAAPELDLSLGDLSVSNGALPKHNEGQKLEDLGPIGQPGRWVKVFEKRGRGAHLGR